MTVTQREPELTGQIVVVIGGGIGLETARPGGTLLFMAGSGQQLVE